MNHAEILSSKPFKLHITLSGTPKATNKLLGHSYWIKHKNAKYWKDLMALAIGYRKPNRPLEKAMLSFKRHSWRMLDFDGLVASMKPIADSLVECAILKNDTFAITGKWDVDQAFRPKKLGSMIEVTIEEVA